MVGGAGGWAGDSLAGRLPYRFKLRRLLPAGFAPATAATAAAESTTATAVAAATAESTALGAGTGFVHVQRAAVQFLTIQGLDGRAEWVDVRKGAAEGHLIEVLGDPKGDLVVGVATDEIREGAAIQNRAK
jgi:hypothetical protein